MVHVCELWKCLYNDISPGGKLGVWICVSNMRVKLSKTCVAIVLSSGPASTHVKHSPARHVGAPPARAFVCLFFLEPRFVCRQWGSLADQCVSKHPRFDRRRPLSLSRCLYTVFIAKFASPPSKLPLYIFNFGYFCCKNGKFFAVFELYRIHLGDLSTYFIDFLLLVEGDLRPVRGCFFFAIWRLHNKLSVFW